MPRRRAARGAGSLPQTHCRAGAAWVGPAHLPSSRQCRESDTRRGTTRVRIGMGGLRVARRGQRQRVTTPKHMRTCQAQQPPSPGLFSHAAGDHRNGALTCTWPPAGRSCLRGAGAGGKAGGGLQRRPACVATVHREARPRSPNTTSPPPAPMRTPLTCARATPPLPPTHIPLPPLTRVCVHHDQRGLDLVGRAHGAAGDGLHLGQVGAA